MKSSFRPQLRHLKEVIVGMRGAMKSVAVPVILVVALALITATASAGDYGGKPKDGPWSGQTKGNRASLKVSANGSRISNFVLHVPYSCFSAEIGRPTSGGSFVFRRSQPVPMEPLTGYMRETRLRPTIPGAKSGPPAELSGLFTARHQIPPPADEGEIELGGGFTRSNGDECEFGHEGIVNWKIHPGR